MKMGNLSPAFLDQLRKQLVHFDNRLEMSADDMPGFGREELYHDLYPKVSESNIYAVA